MSVAQIRPCFRNLNAKKEERGGRYNMWVYNQNFHSDVASGWSADHTLTPKRSGLLGNLPWGLREGSHSPCLEMFSREEPVAATLSLTLSGSTPPPDGRTRLLSSPPSRSLKSTRRPYCHFPPWLRLKYKPEWQRRPPPSSAGPCPWRTAPDNSSRLWISWKWGAVSWSRPRRVHLLRRLLSLYSTT